MIQVTSPTPGDGKSTVAANLAISMAQSGKSVLLIDSDLRRPRVQKLFGIENEKGVAWMLGQLPKSPTAEQVKELLAEVVVDSPVPNLSIIGAGARPDNPSELLSSSQFDSLSEVLKGLFDIVLIDSPPLLAVTDPSTLASRVDGVLLVVRLKKNVKPLAARASRMLETLEANVIGVIVNGVGSRAAKGYGKYADADGYYNRGRYYQYGYGYSYGGYLYNEYNEYYSDKDGERKKKKVKPKAVSEPKPEASETLEA
jgi:capsular exopolysaccharide synthesis family protein